MARLRRPAARQAEADAVVAAAFDGRGPGGRQLADVRPRRGGPVAALGERRREAFVATKVWTSSIREGRSHFAASSAGSAAGSTCSRSTTSSRGGGISTGWSANGASATSGCLGATTYQSAAFAELETVMRTGRIHAIQVPLNPRERDAEARVLPLAADLGLGRPGHAPVRRGRAAQRPFPPELTAAGLAGWPEALLRWCLADPRVTAAIPATGSPEHAMANVEAGSLPPLEPDVRERIGRLAGAA